MSNDAVDKETEQVHEWLRQHGVSDDLHEFSGDPVSKLQTWDLQIEVPVDFIWIGTSPLAYVGATRNVSACQCICDMGTSKYLLEIRTPSQGQYQSIVAPAAKDDPKSLNSETCPIRGWPNGSGGQIGTISGNLLPGITLAVGYDVASMQGTIRTYLAEGPNPKWLELDVDLRVFNRAVKEKGVQTS
ncbi:hypothetical protein JR316_0007573 [Psilocybe cubensis]|uniref:Uncharacterized protein n=1 Tax=Psilocybe cubensis TaxID=181762 RepID=A0ACB8GZC0_PSICU|nr:hypothetical protein JR316_0007573 [Psilocybe cubensis]KAH9480966.1 hypothetical protein JR316_0007573 [Psilocybe cubensis]